MNQQDVVKEVPSPLLNGPSEDNWRDGVSDLSAYLAELLRQPDWGDENSPPLLYVESNPNGGAPDVEESGTPTIDLVPWKRSRYNRRYYSWKRQNRSRNYDSYQYMCTPSRREVFQLLIALHEARSGKLGRTVNFCNRKRPAGAILTNIRFLGRRK